VAIASTDCCVGSKTGPSTTSEATRTAALDGILVLDKPSGPTSSDVVVRVKRLLELERVGHTGTLDPLATGVLPLCIGRATRLSAYLTEQDKVYRAFVRLGARTETGDAEGKVVSERPVPVLSEALLEPALRSLRGDQAQTPPMYSAVKVGGRKLYELARQGQDVQRPARQIQVTEMELESMSPPDLTLRIACSKGTYVRVLAEDLGERLGCGAHLRGLRRLRSGTFDLSMAVKLDDLVRAEPEQRLAIVTHALVPMAEAVGSMERIVLRRDEAAALLAGGRLPNREFPLSGTSTRMVALFDVGGELLALAEARPPSALRLKRVIPRG
jgi:tRNA pseudouridine55 synthase